MDQIVLLSDASRGLVTDCDTIVLDTYDLSLQECFAQCCAESYSAINYDLANYENTFLNWYIGVV